MSKLLSEHLKGIKVLGRSQNKEDVDFMLRYIRCLMEKSNTPELRAHWTMIYKWVDKQIGATK
ncbi:hypothetical protein LCGC14_1624770 [marine sediment metagenome]|uniref:Uncharacterized protein n=1 Tax=marine sediment metagenome TaxID=412755 RepID=A0A0F9L407_9ZZZZ